MATRNDAAPDPPPPLPLPVRSPTRGVASGHGRRGSRGSRFIETPMHEYTPASSSLGDDESLYGHHGRGHGRRGYGYGDLDYADGDGVGRDAYDDDEDSLTRLRRGLRGINAALHAVACVVLLIVMAQFLAFVRRRHVWFRHTECVRLASRSFWPFPFLC